MINNNLPLKGQKQKKPRIAGLFFAIGSQINLGLPVQFLQWSLLFQVLQQDQQVLFFTLQETANIETANKETANKAINLVLLKTIFTVYWF